MRRLFLSLALVPAIASTSAWGQGMGGGEGGAPPPPQGMPAPRQMSGQPRPDQAVPSGMITVKVVRDDLGVLAPAGTPVHLVGVATGGKVTLSTVPVNDQGRAEFKELATDGSAVYYALALFDGDRLVSQPITLPPRVGVRLMLSGRKVDADKKPIGPPIDDEKGGEAAPPAAGVVEVSVIGREPESKVTLRQLGGAIIGEQKVQQDARVARWTDIPSAPDKVYVVEVKGASRTIVSPPFVMAPQAGARRAILAYDKLLFALQGGVQADDEDLSVEMQLVVANMTGVPYETGADGLLVPLPEGFQGAKINEEEPGGKMAIAPGEGVVIHGVVPPGQKEIVVQFSLPIVEGRATFDMPMPLGLFESSLFVAKSGGMVVTTGKGIKSAPKVQHGDDGREYYQLADLTVPTPDAAGAIQHLQFDVAGLPVPQKWQAVSRGLVGILVSALVILAVAYAVRRPGAAMRTPATREDERRELVAQRERLFAELVSLERARVSRRIDPDVFAVQRRGIMTRLVLVHRQLDDLDGDGGASRSTAG